jgi:hypothetical protein
MRAASPPPPLPERGAKPAAKPAAEGKEARPRDLTRRIAVGFALMSLLPILLALYLLTRFGAPERAPFLGEGVVIIVLMVAAARWASS